MACATVLWRLLKASRIVSAPAGENPDQTPGATSNTSSAKNATRIRRSTRSAFGIGGRKDTPTPSVEMRPRRSAPDLGRRPTVAAAQRRAPREPGCPRIAGTTARGPPQPWQGAGRAPGGGGPPRGGGGGGKGSPAPPR